MPSECVCSFMCLVVVIGSLRERRWGNPTPTRPGLNFCASTNEFQLCCVGLAVGSLVLRGGGTISLIPRCILNRRKPRLAQTLSAADATALLLLLYVYGTRQWDTRVSNRLRLIGLWGTSFSFSVTHTQTSVSCVHMSLLMCSAKIFHPL